MKRHSKYTNIGKGKDIENRRFDSGGRNVKVIWVYGPKDSGKTLITYFDGAWPVEFYNGKFTNWEDANTDTIMLDHLEHDDIPINQIIKLIDSCRFDMSPITSTVNRIYLVSRYVPEETFRKNKERSYLTKLLNERIEKRYETHNELPKVLTLDGIREWYKDYVDLSRYDTLQQTKPELFKKIYEINYNERTKKEEPKFMPKKVMEWEIEDFIREFGENPFEDSDDEL